MSQLHLNKGLSLRDSIALVVGSMIGSGVFLKTAVMSQLVGSPSLVMLAWIVAGLLSLLGALTYAELGGLFPQAGGEYIYLKEAYGNLVAFLYGWMRFWVGSPGSIAAGGVGAAAFLSGFWSYEIYFSKAEVAVFIIFVFTFLNCLNVKFGGELQSLLTGLKLLILASIMIGSFFFSQGSFANMQGLSSELNWSSLGTAMIAALWAYDGWNNLPMMAGEVRSPEKNIPRALVIGTFLMLAVYGLMNLAYFYALPFSEVSSSFSKSFPSALPVGAKAASTFLGPAAVGFLSLAFVISVVGSMNGSMMAGPRVTYAMAKDDLFFHQLSKLHPKTQVPYISVLAQGGLSCLLALSGTFDQLTDYVVFGAWLFYALCAASVWIFRQRHPHQHRPYKVPGYPLIPGLFVLLSILLLANAIWSDPRGALFGLLIISTGIPVYYFKLRNR